MLPQKVESVYQLLRATLGVVAVAAGFDKFPELLQDWDIYLAPQARDLLTSSIGAGGPQYFMYAVGVTEVIVGIAVLSGATRVFGYVLCAWLIGIAINLVFGAYYDIAVRDLVIAATAFSLARLAEARAEPLTVAPTVTTVERSRVLTPR